MRVYGKCECIVMKMLLFSVCSALTVKYCVLTVLHGCVCCYVGKKAILQCLCNY